MKPTNHIKEICIYAEQNGIEKTLQLYNLKQSSLERYMREYSREKVTEKDNEDIQDLEFKGAYIYNAEHKKYVFLIAHKIGKNIVLEESLVKSLLKAYSNYDNDPSSINLLTNQFNIPRIVIIEVLQALGITHDSLPLTDEELIRRNEQQVVEEILQDKRFTIFQELNKREWKRTQSDAKKWQSFEAGQINPFKDFIATFESQVKQYSYIKKLRPVKRILVPIISDIHFGSIVHGDSLYHGKEWNIELAVEAISKYLDYIVTLNNSYNTKFDKCIILIAGDIIHSLTGTTQKGTQLYSYPLNQQQFDVAYTSLEYFIDGCRDTFGLVDIYAVAGNHSYTGDWALMKCLEKSYQKIKSVNIEVANTRWLPINILDNFFILEHGSSAFYKSKVPINKIARDKYIQDLFLSKTELLENTTNKYFITADSHSLSYDESNNFEFIRVSSPVAGDKYSDELNLFSRPRQNCLIVDSNGVQSIINIYLDS